MPVVNGRIEAIFPGDDVRVGSESCHDPNVVRFDDHFVLIATSGDSFVPIWTSCDLQSWTAHGPILPEPPMWLAKAVPDHRSIWAPAPLKVGRALRIYYCASQKFGSNTSFIGMVECRDFHPLRPAEGWIDHGMLVQSEAGKDNFNAIDPDAIIDQEGRHWMTYGSYWHGMYLVELDPATGRIKDPSLPAIHVASNLSEPGNPLEAPCIRFHDGYYYLFVTYGLAAQGIRSSYRTVVGRSPSIQGPYVGYDGVPMTNGGHTGLLKSSPPMFGPGGGNMFIDEDGKGWLAYHYYDSRRHWHHDTWGRPTLQIREVLWGADGWPLPGPTLGTDLSPSPSPVGDWIFQVDFADPKTLTLSENGVGRLDAQAVAWKKKGGHLRIRSEDGDAFAWDLNLHPSGRYAAGRTPAGLVVRGALTDV